MSLPALLKAFRLEEVQSSRTSISLPNGRRYLGESILEAFERVDDLVNAQHSNVRWITTRFSSIERRVDDQDHADFLTTGVMAAAVFFRTANDALANKNGEMTQSVYLPGMPGTFILLHPLSTIATYSAVCMTMRTEYSVQESNSRGLLKASWNMMDSVSRPILPAYLAALEKFQQALQAGC